MSEIRDHVSIHIDNILMNLPPSSPSNPTIFRVHNNVRYGNENLYDPKTISVGPFHHGKNHLERMQHHKLNYLRGLMRRRQDATVERYIVVLRSLEQKARACYSGPVELNSDQFVEMLLLDGIFIIELLRKFSFEYLREEDDVIFRYKHIHIQLCLDFMLVENQIPFFVLDELFNMTATEDHFDEIPYLVRRFVSDIFPWPEPMEILGSTDNTDHLLGLVYKNLSFSFAEVTTNRPIQTKEGKPIDSITELQESGVKFEKCSGHISFVRGVLRIPCFEVSDSTESILRNLITYEHLSVHNRPKYMTDYVYFLHCLVNSSRDVEILRRRGIITNFLGDDDMVYGMLNRLGRDMFLSSEFCYEAVFKGVNEHCVHRRNRWMAILRGEYFNTPWSILKFVAALLVLGFTLIQTVFGALSYVKPPK
ncbi:hypothetical protein CASFOL_003858 [Castilleja foliolosa]|uniref:Uncharacterized protein n=1 Tax=Castilleja foliolosa TaxID=1961234 RepID=A0ABD3EIX5_9LAMI